MQTHLTHLLFKVAPSNLPFYKELFAFLGWQIWHDVPEMLGLGAENGVSVWFDANVTAGSNDYDGPGLNHFAIGTATQADVDATASYLAAHGIPALFDTPRHRPEFISAKSGYYQVMFETPDRILIEVVYNGLPTT